MDQPDPTTPSEQPTTDATLEATNSNDPMVQDETRLSEEFREFGRNLIRALRSVATSDELRNLGNEIVESLRDIGEEVQETVERTREKEEVRAVGDQARRVSQAVSSGIPARELASDMQTNLSQALRSLNGELNKLVDQIQSRTARVSDEVESTAQEAVDTVQEGVERVQASAQNVADEVSPPDEVGAAVEESGVVTDTSLGQSQDAATDLGNQTEDGSDTDKGDTNASESEDVGLAMLEQAERDSENGIRPLSEIVSEIQEEDSTPSQQNSA